MADSETKERSETKVRTDTKERTESKENKVCLFLIDIVCLDCAFWHYINIVD